MSRERVYVTNMPTGIPGMLFLFFLVALFMSSCTDECKNISSIQCAGKISKEVVVEFNKGYHSVKD